MSKRIAVILNTGSGSASLTVAELESLLVAHGVVATVVSPKAAEEVSGSAVSLVRDGYDIVVAAGGDGTVSTVASALVESKTIMGVLPLGTLNHFAKDAGIPLTLPEAVRNLAEGEPVNVDVGDVNGKTFINNISLGLYPAFVEARGNVRHLPRLMRWYSILKAAMEAIQRSPALRARVVIDGAIMKRLTPIVFIGNNAYELEGTLIGGRRSLNAGNLSIIMTRRRGPWGIVRLVARAALGTLRGAKDLDALLAKEIEVDTKDRHVKVAVDGEVTESMKRPLRCTVRPGALRVLVPIQSSVISQH